MTEKRVALPSQQLVFPPCKKCGGERVIMTKPAGAGHADDLAEYDPCPTCKGTGVSSEKVPASFAANYEPESEPESVALPSSPAPTKFESCTYACDPARDMHTGLCFKRRYPDQFPVCAKCGEAEDHLSHERMGHEGEIKYHTFDPSEKAESVPSTPSPTLLHKAVAELLKSLTCHCDKSLIPLINIDGTCARCNRKTYLTSNETRVQDELAKLGVPSTPVETSTEVQDKLVQWRQEIASKCPFEVVESFAGRAAEIGMAGKATPVETASRPHLVYEAKAMILKRWAKYSDPNNEDWEIEKADRWERHAINAVLDLEKAELELTQVREELETVYKTRQIAIDRFNRTNQLWQANAEKLVQAAETEKEITRLRSALEQAKQDATILNSELFEEKKQRSKAENLRDHAQLELGKAEAENKALNQELAELREALDAKQNSEDDINR